MERPVSLKDVRGKLKQVKVVLMGEAGIGKTSVFKALGNDEGDVVRKDISIYSPNSQEGVTVQMELHDTGGMERLGRSLTQNYFRNAAATILCYSKQDRTTLERYAETFEDAHGQRTTYLQHLMEYSALYPSVSLFLCGINNVGTLGNSVETSVDEQVFEHFEHKLLPITVKGHFLISLPLSNSLESVQRMFSTIAVKTFEKKSEACEQSESVKLESKNGTKQSKKCC